MVNKFWAGVVKNGRGLLDYGTLKSDISQEWIDELNSFFLHADSDAIILVRQLILLCILDFICWASVAVVLVF